jgi:hypothetical protein
MSRSKISIELYYSMLDGREECVPEMAGWSGGHKQFKSGRISTRVCGPASWTFDELDGPYDREACVQLAYDKLKEELMSESGAHMLKSMLGNMFDQAKAHCDAEHQEYRKQKNPGRKGH